MQTILEQPRARPLALLVEPAQALPAALNLPQRAVERELAHYEQYVANRAALGGGGE